MAMLLAVAFLFLDFSHALPSAWFRALTWLQFVPSLLQFFQMLGHGLALGAYGFLVILALTLLFGRVYCSFLCPLGALKDLLSWLSAKVRRKKGRFRFAPPWTRLRYSILVVVCLSLFSGSLFFVNLLDPFSNFGRFFSDLFRPAYMLGNNALASLFEALGSHVFYPITLAKAKPLALLVPVGMLVLVVWLALKRGRLYCNTLCPVGTLLGLLSKVSLYKIRFDSEGCNRCGNCVFACKSQCIDIQKKEVDFSRCVGCGNCLRACDKSGIRYAWAFARDAKKKAAPAVSAPAAQSVVPKHCPTDGGFNRRFILGGALSVAASVGLPKALAQSRCKEGGEACVAGHNSGIQEVRATQVATPPGSLGWKHFTGACTACHLCVSACPSGVLRPSLFEYGALGLMQPFMDFDAGFCNHACTKCGEICPTGAILPLSVEKKQTTQVGVVRFEQDNCVVVTEGTACGACSELCPTQAVRMVPYEGSLTLPETSPDICIGCGACQYACPTLPFKAIVVDGLGVHKAAQKPKAEKLEAKPLEDFPF